MQSERWVPISKVGTCALRPQDVHIDNLGRKDSPSP
jgi:hypothetical protein